MNSWWPDNRLFQPQLDEGEEATPHHVDVSDRINRQLQLRVGDVVWCARRPAVPEVSDFLSGVYRSGRRVCCVAPFTRSIEFPPFHTLKLLTLTIWQSC